MAERNDLLTLTLTKYQDPRYGFRHMGPSRWALDFGRLSLIIELWWTRD